MLLIFSSDRKFSIAQIFFKYYGLGHAFTPKLQMHI